MGVRLTDPNLDDLTLQLTSPQGTSLVLFENRGGLLASNLGLTLINSAGTNTFTTNYIYTTFTEDTNLATTPIKFAPPPYAIPAHHASIVGVVKQFRLLHQPGGFLYQRGRHVQRGGQLYERTECGRMVCGKPTY